MEQLRDEVTDWIKRYRRANDPTLWQRIGEQQVACDKVEAGICSIKVRRDRNEVALIPRPKLFDMVLTRSPEWPYGCRPDSWAAIFQFSRLDQMKWPP